MSADIIDNQPPERFLNRRVHMANERTFLAWIRTSLGMMVFGFVLEKFALFTKQMAYIMGQSSIDKIDVPYHGYSAILGISLVILGTVMSALAFIKYKKIQKQIDTDTWKTSPILNTVLTLFIVSIGVILVFYLITNH